ncbi:MAG TPA: alcohol dehydrogenase catalytic domain-containing protein [Actinomycetota bacterium]|nr:alcohol dehydrogenase catalytic domain-containing protein [Actinomycetota bacterium]
MRAVVLEGSGTVAVREVPDPRVEDADDAIVRVTLSAICGSDLHFLHGKAPMEPGEPIGHEAVGVVERAGPSVTSVSEGDRVVVSFVIACGACWFCRVGQTQLCEDFRNLGAGIFGGGLGGAQAEYVRVPHADVNLLRVPGDVPDERAVFLGDVLTTGVYAAGSAGVGEGDVVAVVGAGPVGFFVAQAAKMLGAAEVVVLDTEPDRLAVAERVGASVVNVSERHAQMALADRTEGRGADVAIEAVGSADAFDVAVDVVRRGGVVVVVGMFTGESIEIPAGVFWARALDVRFAGICPVHAWWERALEAVRSKAIVPDPIVSHRLPLDDAPNGYELFDSRRATKVLLVP